MKSIMLATDFSERSDRALRRATLLAEEFDASLSIVHVVDDDQPQHIVDRETEIAENHLRVLKSTVTKVDGIACTSEVRLAAPDVGIAQAVQNAKPDLLVIGPHRRQALRDVFVGTTAERTIRSVECPLLMVNAPPVGPYRRVLLSTDFSAGARCAVQCFQALGMARKTDVAMLHVFDAPALGLAMSHTMSVDERKSYIADQSNNAERDLSDFAASLDAFPVRQVLRYAERAPAREIQLAAQSEEADLIVVGTQGASGLLRFFLGSVAKEVLRTADRDVLAVPLNSQSGTVYSDRSE